MADVQLDWQDNAVGESGYAVERFTRPPLIFASDWRTASLDHLGSSDNGKWVLTNNNNPDDQTVVAGAGLDFPTQNVYRCIYNGASYNVSQIFAPTLAPGEQIFYRVYFRSFIDSGVNPGSSNHPTEHTNTLGTSCVRPMSFNFDLNPIPALLPFEHTWIQTYDNQPGSEAFQHRWRVDINQHQTYRAEWNLQRIDGAESWNLNSRFFTSDDQLLYSNEDFICTNFGHNNHNLNTVRPNSVFLPQFASCMSGLIIGYQGGYVYPGEGMYWGGFAVSRDNWIGSYVLGEAD